MTKIDRTVVRNIAYARNNFSIRERHNERKNEIYSNPDIVQGRSHLNIRYKGCNGTYTQAFDRLLEDGTISTRGLKPDADVFAEMVFDVNTSYFEHMKKAGFKDFERGVRGSTTQNLSVLDYKVQQDNEKLFRIEKQVEKQQKELVLISEQLVVEHKASKTFHELDELGRKKMFGKVELTEQDYKEVISLAKEGVLSRSKITELTRQLREMSSRLFSSQNNWEQLYEQTSDFLQAMKLAPQRVKEVISEVFLKDREEREARRNLRHVSRKRDERER